MFAFLFQLVMKCVPAASSVDSLGWIYDTKCISKVFFLMASQTSLRLQLNIPIFRYLPTHDIMFCLGPWNTNGSTNVCNHSTQWVGSFQQWNCYSFHEHIKQVFFFLYGPYWWSWQKHQHAKSSLGRVDNLLYMQFITFV